MLSKTAKHAFEKGYRIKGNKVISPEGNVRKLSWGSKNSPYPYFCIRHNGKPITVRAHLLAAWQKFGKKSIGEEVLVRHLDDNKNNFSLDNIALGNASQNAYDRERNFKTKHYKKMDHVYFEEETEIPF